MSAAALPVHRRVRLLLGFARPARAALALAVVLAFAATLLELAPFVVIYLAVLALVEGTVTAGGLIVLGVAAAGAVLARSALWAAATTVAHRAAFEAQYAMRTRLAEHLDELPLGWFDEHPGRAEQTLTQDVERTELLVAHAVPELTAAVTGWLVVTAALLVLDWRMALATVAVVPLAHACLQLALRNMSGRVGATDAAGARMHTAVVEMLRGLPVLTVFGRAGTTLDATRAAIDDYADAATASARAYYPLGTVYQNLVVANVVVVVPVGLWLLAAGSLDVATLLLFVTISLGYSLPLLRLSNLGINLTYMSAGAISIRSLLDTPAQPAPTGAVRLGEPAVAFRDVTFGYGPDGSDDVLHGIDVVAPAGCTTALVGPSGAGKTTLARLVPRFADPWAGTVTIGGVAVDRIPVEQLMDTVAFVLQEPFLFHDTVRANIALGRPGAGPEEIVAAARAARADEFVRRLPQGYDTVLGERGESLSAGERQRLTIARALLKDAPVVVLDEATAFADPDSETAILDAVRALTAGRTVIVVAHRLATVASADRIVVLDRGRVVEQGTHAELLEAGGLYARMWDDQRSDDGAATG